MNRRLVVAVAAVAVAASAMAAGAPQQAATGIDQLSWLAGCWASRGGPRQVDEQWMKPAGGTMMGMSRTVAGGKTVEWETLMIRQSGDQITYTAKPSGQAEATFTLTHAAAGEARFENPAHDFPQRIIYRLQPDGGLTARIEGTRNGQLRGVDFPMTKGSC